MTMMQGTPAPPTPQDIGFIINQLIPIFGMATGIIITGFVALGPVGRAIGRVIMKLFGAAPRDAALGSGDAEEIIARLDAIQSHLADLAERQDFSERMLAQVRREKALPEGTVQRCNIGVPGSVGHRTARSSDDIQGRSRAVLRAHGGRRRRQP